MIVNCKLCKDTDCFGTACFIYSFERGLHPPIIPDQS